MARYACTKDGIRELNTAADRITEGAEAVKAATNIVRSVTDEFRDTLGPHAGQLEAALNEVAEAVDICIEPATGIATKLRGVAGKYQEIVDKMPFRFRPESASDDAWSTTGSSGAGIAAAGSAAGAAGAAGAADRPGVVPGWKKIEGAHDYKSDMKAVNPGYSTQSLEWTNNCQRCVPAYELRQRGYDVQATPRPTVLKKSFFTGEVEKVVTSDDHLSWHPFDAWIPPDSVPCPGGIGDIERQMREWGDGARAEVMVYWQGAHGGGHVFVAQQINGITHFIDPQSGEEGVGYYFDHCITERICICRTDNKIPSGYVMDCCA